MKGRAIPIPRNQYWLVGSLVGCDPGSSPLEGLQDQSWMDHSLDREEVDWMIDWID